MAVDSGMGELGKPGLRDFYARYTNTASPVNVTVREPRTGGREQPTKFLRPESPIRNLYTHNSHICYN